MHFERYIRYLQSEKRASDHTVSAYRNDLQKWSDYLSTEFEEEDPSRASPAMVRSWMAWSLDRGITARSIQRRLSALKSYYRFLKRAGVREDNPASTVVAPKLKKKLPEYVKPLEMEELLDDGQVFEDDFSGWRDRLIIELFYATGIRRAELIGLKGGNIDFQNGRLKVLGKRNKERIIPVSSKLCELLERYQHMRNHRFSQPESPQFFLTDSGKSLYPKFVYRLVNRYLQKVSSLNKRSPHVLRHTFATHMLNNGADLNAIKELLGHASLSATQVYTHNSIAKLKEIHQQAHPKA